METLLAALQTDDETRVPDRASHGELNPEPARQPVPEAADVTGLSASLIRHNGPLFRRLYQFNFSPAEYLHVTQRPRFVPQPGAASLWSHPRSRAGLSALVLAQLNLSGQADFNTRHAEWPLVLLPTERLLRLAAHAGALLVSGRVRRAMARAEVLSWKESLGAELYQFAMTGATLLPVPPEVLAMEPAVSTGHSPLALGLACVDAATGKAPAGMVRRLRLKYPAELALPALPTDTAAALAWTVLSALERKWVSSFATTRA